MSAKILVSGLANTGKTTLLKDLEDVLIIAHDGKKYPFPQPHVNVDTFEGAQDLINITNAKVTAYQERFGKLPKTIGYDSVSKIFETLSNYCNRKYSGFTIYTELNKEIALFTEYIENVLVANGVNIILVSHALWDVDTATYQLVGNGAFAKKGGFLSEVDNAVFVEVKSNKRVVHHRSNKFASRSILAELPDNEPADGYNMQRHVDMLVAKKDEVVGYTL